MDNQNNNSYTNFNAYPASGTPDPNTVPQQPVQQPVQQQPYAYGSNQQIPYNPYQVPVQQESKHKSLVLGILSIVIPIISCTYLSPIGLILAIIGVIRNKKSAVSWVGLVISLLCVAFLAFVIYLIVNPDEYRAFLEMSGAYSDEQIDELMRQITGFIAM
jgi:hypothetical protein